MKHYKKLGLLLLSTAMLLLPGCEVDGPIEIPVELLEAMEQYLPVPPEEPAKAEPDVLADDEPPQIVEADPGSTEVPDAPVREPEATLAAEPDEAGVIVSVTAEPTTTPEATAVPELTATPRPTEMPKPTVTPTPTPDPTPTPHVHNWTLHEEIGHYKTHKTGTEEVLVGTYWVEIGGWDEELDACYRCNDCMAAFPSNLEASEHITSANHSSYSYYPAETYHHWGEWVEEPRYETRDVYEDVWVIDQEAYWTCTCGEIRFI